MHVFPVKTGYVRLIDGNGNCRELYRYERLLMNPLLLDALRKETLTVNRLYCCCRKDCSAPVRIQPIHQEGSGELIGFTPEQHTESCRNFLSRLLSLFGTSFLRAFCFPEEPLKLNFHLSPDQKKYALVIDEKAGSAGAFSWFGERATLEQLLYVINVRAFGGLTDNTRKLYREEDLFPEEFLSALEGTTVAFPDGTMKRISWSDIYSEKLTPVDATGFLFGKVTRINLDQIPEKDETDREYYSRLWIRVRDHDGKEMTLAVSRKDFRNLYYQLPETGSVYIFGKATHKQETVFDRGANKLPTAPKERPKIPEQHELPKKDVSVCRQYVLFSVNSSGMIVFSREEYENSERFLRERKKLYRPLVSKASKMGVPRIHAIRDEEEDLIV